MEAQFKAKTQYLRTSSLPVVLRQVDVTEARMTQNAQLRAKLSAEPPGPRPNFCTALSQSINNWWQRCARLPAQPPTDAPPAGRPNPSTALSQCISNWWNKPPRVPSQSQVPIDINDDNSKNHG